MFKKAKIKLNEYLNLKYLLHDESVEKKASIEDIKVYWRHKDSTHIEKLLQWLKQNQQHLDSDKIDRVKNRVTLSFIIVTLVMFIVGFLLGFSLLSYDDRSIVNVTWFLFIMIFLPFILSIFSFFYSIIVLYNKNSSTKNKYTQMLEETVFKPLSKLLLNPSSIMPNDLIKNILLVRLQQGSLALLIGTMIALFVTLLAKYVVFGWESTIIDTSSLQSLINFIAFPWIFCCPSAVPSLEVIEDTQNYLSNSIILSQSWWKFLGMSLIVYGFIPRFILLYLSNKIFYNGLRENILNDKNAKEILLFIQKSSNVTTTQFLHKNHKTKDESSYTSHDISKKTVEKSFDYIIGWSLTMKALRVMLEHKKMSASHIEIAGGSVSVDREDELISSIEGCVIIFVDSWEAPQKDFVNFVSNLSKSKVSSILIYPLGMADDDYKPKSKNVSIWKNKIEIINNPKIGIYDA
ncbi:hypothetical protein M947_08695 [Sulfurimonas hongkongensis]|uniref:DUF2868 domain-containing protein n=1 Tax=Sulfurimonas hongkongensis TaxID=1172190 RepID=T0JPL5_9BACT|nr:DUF2868 domain-containing protein [Sulfurimonas hongkongensis]EQB38767.1 hypothetical protein M947_08695 [Sulfurimonas hongkongensis]